MLQVKDLQPLDFIVSYKEPSNFFEKIGNAGIISYGKKLYPGGIWRANHIRLMKCTKWDKETQTSWAEGFEWTHPKSRCFPIQEWMLTESYSWVLRFKEPFTFDVDQYYAEFDKHTGKRYDYLQLLGIYLGCKWLHCGESREVCSTGARELFEILTKKLLFSEIERWRTPPCSWLNSFWKFEWLNEPEGADINPLLKRALERRSSLVTDEMALL